jgi:ribonucleoside-diphosphate reductase alpha chain
MTGPQLPFSDNLHASKYRSPGESFGESQDRVASALTISPDQYQVTREIMRAMRFMPGGRVQSGCGAPKVVTPYNCFVSGTIADSFVHGDGCIMDRAKEAATTMRMGGGIGYDFSTLRPRGATIKKLGSISSGPIAFMDIFNAVCHCTASSGNRRGAQMGVLRVDHPDIAEFIQSKQNHDRLTGFNISVAVTDEFMEAVRAGTTFDLRFNGEVWETIDARALWEMIMRSTYRWAEPGVLFIDRINSQNNLGYCETIVATNPCGEQPLPPFGACLLGSFNLVKYLEAVGRGFDFDRFAQDIPSIVRAMDRVVDIAHFPLKEQQSEALSKRRMGLGVTALANAGEVLGRPYGSAAFLEFEEEVMAMLRDEAYRASALLAAELGAFPLFRRDEYLERPFIKTLPADVRDLIAKHGIRNSHLLSIAPTGTISLCADNVSSGIEPVFSYTQKRIVKTADGEEMHELEDYAVRVHGVRGRRAEEVSPQEHLNVLATAQSFVDSSVSKTINVPKDISWEAFKLVYMHAWEQGCKGCTTYRPGERGAVLTAADDDLKPSACSLDPVTGRSNCE